MIGGVRPRSGLFLDDIKLGDVVAAHTLWHEGTSALPPALQGMHGIESLAGHCFDITTVRGHKRQEESAGRLAEWTNISKKKRKEMRTLWRAHRGEYV